MANLHKTGYQIANNRNKSDKLEKSAYRQIHTAL